MANVCGVHMHHVLETILRSVGHYCHNSTACRTGRIGREWAALRIKVGHPRADYETYEYAPIRNPWITNHAELV